MQNCASKKKGPKCKGIPGHKRHSSTLMPAFSHPDFHCRPWPLTRSACRRPLRTATRSRAGFAVSANHTAGRELHPVPKPHVQREYTIIRRLCKCSLPILGVGDCGMSILGNEDPGEVLLQPSQGPYGIVPNISAHGRTMARHVVRQDASAQQNHGRLTMCLRSFPKNCRWIFISCFVWYR